MKKILFKMVLLVGMLLLVPYYMLGGGTMPDFIKDIFKSGKEVVAPLNGMSTVTTDKEITLYKCTDDQGRIEFSQAPCLGEGETIHLQPNVNVVQRTKIPEEEEVEAGGGSVITLGSSNKDADTKGKDKKDKNKNDDGLDLGNPYDPDNIQKLVKDAKGVDNLMDQHIKQLESATTEQK